MQQRLEETDWGRGLLSVVIGITLATVLTQQLPNSYLRAKLDRVFAPYAKATGLEQDWAVFAPNPRRMVIEVEGRVKYADGSTSTWRIPRSDDFLGVYWDYRWLKLVEHVHPDSGAPLWQGVALYVARQQRRAVPMVAVDLVRRWSELRPPGPGPSRSPWQEYSFYSLPSRLLAPVNVEAAR